MATSSEETMYHIINIPNGIVQADDKVIVLLGPTGVGKSNFIEQLAANDLRISSSGTRRGTNDLQVYRLMHHPIWNSRIVLVDTPGFKDAELSEYGTLKIVKEWLATCKASRLHALFYFDRITYILKKGDKECYELFMRLCGKDGAARACLVTTTWDEVRTRDAMSTAAAAANKSLLAAQEKRRQLNAHWKSYLGKGLQFCEFQNTSASAMEILMNSLKCDNYSHRFILEDPKLNLIKPPLKRLIFELLKEKYNTTMDALSSLAEDINMLHEQGQETERFVKKLEALRVVVKQLEDEILEFKGGRQIVEERKKKQQAEPPMEHQPSEQPNVGQQREAVTLDFLTETQVGLVTIKSSDIQLDDIVIAVIGASGTGKTTFIEAVAGTINVGLDVGHSLSAGTAEVSCVKIAIPGTHSSLILVDTPGFDDPDKTDAQILEIIANWLESTYRRRILLTGLVYLHRITDIRHDVGIQNTMNVFQRLSGPNAFERVALVTTMWNDLVTVREKQIGVEREEQLMNNWRPMIIRKAMTGRFDSRNRDTAVKVIRDIVERNTKTVLLQLQEELVDKKKSLPSTSAGKVAFTLEEAMKWHLRHFMGSSRR